MNFLFCFFDFVQPILTKKKMYLNSHNEEKGGLKDKAHGQLSSLQINQKDKTPKYKQIVKSVIKDIERGYYTKNDQLMSITELSIEYLLSRDTVEKAYRELKILGYIESVHGKGFFVKSVKEQKTKVLFVMNKMSSYKKIIYYSLLEKLGSDAKVDLHIHNYDLEAFDDIIEKNIGNYNYYIVMPHFRNEYQPESIQRILNKIPKNELILLDKKIAGFEDVPTIYQDFEKDIFNVFEQNLDILNRYEKLEFIFPANENYPKEIAQGFRTFCAFNNITSAVSTSASDALRGFENKTLYVVIEDNDLASVIKFSKEKGLKLGSDIGLISFNDTTLKEVLGVTVITTDFEAMGKRAGEVLLNKLKISEKNDFYLINRDSA